MLSSKKLIDALISSEALQTPIIIRAFEKIDRKYFVDKEFREHTYRNAPLPIGKNQTISQPSTVAFMLEHLAPKKGEKILDIGSGSGWTTALLCYIVGEKGSVLGLERVDELVDIGKKNLAQFHFTNQCTIQISGIVLGMPDETFDKILVSASAKKIPDELFSQLNIGGILVVPVENSIYRFKKISDTKIETKEFPGFVFVPLIT